MAESQLSTRKVEESETQTVVVENAQSGEQGQPVLHLRLQQSKNDQKVKWSTDTIDNEMMGKKKSKCCCIYEKPKVFGESDTSSSSEDDDCTHCRGHKKKCFRNKPQNLDHEDHCDNETGANSH